MELRHIRCVLAVAETLHFGRAAERLYVTQPALSQHIRNLERELHCQLFDRSSRRVTLTPAGEVFVAGARTLLTGASALVEATRSAQVGESGTIAIGVDGAGAEAFLTDVLGTWALSTRGVRSRLVSGAHSDLIDLVHSRDLDVALIVGQDAVPWATVTALDDLRLGAIVPVGHPLAGRATIEPADLAGERLIVLPYAFAPAMTDRVAALWAADGATFEPSLELRDASLMRMAVGAGMGVAIAAGASPDALPAGLVAVPFAAADAVVPVVAVWRPDCSMQARAFVRVAAKASADEPPGAMARATERRAS